MTNEGRTENLRSAESLVEEYFFQLHGHLDSRIIQIFLLRRLRLEIKLFLLSETNQIQQYFRLCFFVFSGNHSKKFSILFLALEIINTFSFLL